MSRFLLKLRLILRVFWDGDLTDSFVWLPDRTSFRMLRRRSRPISGQFTLTPYADNKAARINRWE